MERRKSGTDRSLRQILKAVGLLAVAVLVVVLGVAALRPADITQATGTYHLYLPGATSVHREPDASRLGVWTGGIGAVADPTVASRLRESGANWTRVFLDWRNVPKLPNGDYNFAGYDSQLTTLRTLGVQTLVEVRGNPTAAATSTCGPIDKAGGLDAFESFLRQAVTHFSAYGVHNWELYNEPDNKEVAFGEQTGIGCWGAAPDAYVAMLQRGYRAVHELDAEGQVVLGGLAFDCFNNGQSGDPCGSSNYFVLSFLDDILSRGAGQYFDVANVHAFSSQNQTNRGGTSLISQFWGNGFDVVGKVVTLRQVMSARGVSKPVAITELSWTNNTDLEQQARYVPKVLARGLEADVHFMTWFSLTEISNSFDSGGVAYGLTGPGTAYTPRSSLAAFSTAVREFGVNTAVRKIAASEVGATGSVEGYAFTMPGGLKRWVLWARVDGQSDGGGTVVSIRIPQSVTAAYNKSGSSISVQPGSTYSLTDDPIYLRMP